MSSNSDLIRIPPRNIEAEIYFLASLLLDPESYNKLSEIKIFKEDFFDEKHRNIYTAILEHILNNHPIDIITINETLKNNGLLESAGGTDYISSLLDKLPSSENIVHYAKIIKEKSLLRSLIRISSELVSKSYEGEVRVKELIESAEKKLLELNESTNLRHYTTIQEGLLDTVNKILNAVGNPTDITGVPSGYTDLDDITDGFKNSEMIILAARPGMGKTTLALNIMANAAIKHKKKVAFFCGEMSTENLIRRVLCSEARLNDKLLRKGLLNSNEKTHLVRAAEKLYDVNMIFDDTPNIPLFELKTKARKMYRDVKIDMIIVDYLQLVTVGDELGKNIPLHERIGHISRSIKGLARELNIPILALAQLNRNVESRGRDDARPKKSDLKDSGSIEQDADMILFIHKNTHKSDDEDNKQTDVEEVEVIVGKNRNGPEGISNLVFFKNFTRFESKKKEIY